MESQRGLRKGQHSSLPPEFSGNLCPSTLSVFVLLSPSLSTLTEFDPIRNKERERKRERERERERERCECHSVIPLWLYNTGKSKSSNYNKIP